MVDEISRGITSPIIGIVVTLKLIMQVSYPNE